MLSFNHKATDFIIFMDESENIREIPPEAKWYALRTFTSHEQKVKLFIESEIKRLKLQDKIFDVIIPQETVFEVRQGKRKTRVKNFLPGYIIIRTILDKIGRAHV